MDVTQQFRINSPNVVHEAFDDEVVVVNLETGSYYCLQRASATLWLLLVQGASVKDIAGVFVRRFAAAVDDIERQSAGLVDVLVREGLIVPSDGTSAAPQIDDAAVAEPRPAFELPPLQTYSDMQALLVLDPIHEVDSSGWPVAKPPAAE